MKKISGIIFFTAIFCFGFCMAEDGPRMPAGRDNPHNELRVSAIAGLTVSDGENGPQGVLAAFFGMLDGTLVVAGGCNFPEVPAADGGEKVFYREIWGMRNPLVKDARWEKLGELPEAAAYGACGVTPAGIVCVGGKNAENSLRTVWILKWNAEKTRIVAEVLSMLPVTLDEAAGAVMTQKIAGMTKHFFYVAGGNAEGKPSARTFRLNLSDAHCVWEEIPAFPGKGRVQPVAAVQNTATEKHFFLMGGYHPRGEVVADTAQGADTQPAEIFSDGYRFNPAAGAHGTWTSVAACVPHEECEPRALVGAVCVPSGSHHLLVMGGVNRERFFHALNHPGADADYMKHAPQWYGFNRNLLVYHTLTDAWVAEGEFPELARVGAAVVPCEGGGTWLVVGGELKPGVRSVDACVLEIMTRTRFGALNWAVLGVYLLTMLGVGYYFMRRTADSDDFFKGGGRIPWWAAGISIYATMISAITYMGIPAKVFATDWTYYPFQLMIPVISIPVIIYYLPFFRRLNVASAYEYLENRFNYAIRLMASLLFITFMLARTALVLYLPSLALATVAGIDIYTCIMLMGVVTVIYCTMGGVEAVVWGDVIQGFILVAGAIFAAVYLVFRTEGGPAAFLEIGEANHKFRLFIWALDPTKVVFWVAIVGGLANNLITHTSDQAVIQRYLTTKDEKSAGRGIILNAIMNVLVSIAFYTIGTGLYTFFKTHPQEMDFTLANSDAIFPFFMMSQLPVGVAGLLIAAIFAAAMSTISSNINSTATAFSMDIYRKIFPKSDDRHLLRIARWCCLLTGLLGMVLAVVMATWNIHSLLDYFNKILGLLTGSLCGLFVMGIFFPRINARGALAGFVAGTLTVFAVSFYTAVSFMLYGAIGIVASVLVAWLWSLVDPQRTPQPGLTRNEE